jgi:hypothetical protein
MIMDDTSTDIDALREDLKFELIVLHGEVKELNKSWDFTSIVNPLLADQGPALLVVPIIKKQIERLKKLKEDFEQKARDLQRPAAALAELLQKQHSHFTLPNFPSRRRASPPSNAGQCRKAKISKKQAARSKQAAARCKPASKRLPAAIGEPQAASNCKQQTASRKQPPAQEIEPCITGFKQLL